jgi:hypothetical protein
MQGKSSIKDAHICQRIVNVSIVIDRQRKPQGLILGHLDALPLVFGLDVVGNKMGAETDKPVLKSVQDTHLNKSTYGKKQHQANNLTNA